jgi:predicted nucleotidyltransferase
MNALDRQCLLEAARDALAAALPDAWVIYVYGSFARGDEWPQSDLDLAVLLPPGAVIADKLALMAEVSRCVARDVDIVSLRDADLDLVHEVLKDGRALLVRSKSEALGWEAERMTDYALLNARRADILAGYLHGPLRPSR